MALKVQVALEAARGGIEEVVVAGKERLLAGFPGTRIVGAAARGGGRRRARGERPGMSALLPVYERDLVIVSGKGTRVTDDAGPDLPGLRGGHRRERPRVRRPQGRGARSASRPAA